MNVAASTFEHLQQKLSTIQLPDHAILVLRHRHHPGRGGARAVLHPPRVSSFGPSRSRRPPHATAPRRSQRGLQRRFAATEEAVARKRWRRRQEAREGRSAEASAGGLSHQNAPLDIKIATIGFRNAPTGVQNWSIALKNTRRLIFKKLAKNFLSNK